MLLYSILTLPWCKSPAMSNPWSNNELSVSSTKVILLLKKMLCAFGFHANHCVLMGSTWKCLQSSVSHAAEHTKNLTAKRYELL